MTTQHKRRSPCCRDEVLRFLAAARATSTPAGLDDFLLDIRYDLQFIGTPLARDLTAKIDRFRAALQGADR